MSDDEEYEYEYDDDVEMEDEEDHFEYTDDEEEADDAEVALENAYYNSKGLREVDLKEAALAFEQVIAQEKEELRKQDSIKKYGSWSYKAIKQLVKLHLRTGNATEMMKHYDRLLECIAEGDVSPNAIEKGINGMLERVSSLYQQQQGNNNNNNNNNNENAASSSNSGSTMDPQKMALAVYDATLRVFHPQTGVCPNERLWFKTNLKYGQLLYEINETQRLQQVLKDLKSVTQKNIPASGDGGAIQGPQSMEIYALQIQLYSRQKDNKKLRDVFNKAMSVRGGIPHPRTLALIQELGGKMHMASREYESAGKTFFQAFKSYDEAGDISRLRCLKYLVLASMLGASSINPFDSQEARPYRDDPEIVAMTNLVQAFHNNEIQTFERILKQNQGRIMEDEFVREHIEDLLRTIRTQVLRRVIRPYTRISLEAISRELNDIPLSDVESLLVSLILDGSLNGHIDQVQNVLIKKEEKGGSSKANGQNASDGAGGAAGSATASSSASGRGSAGSKRTGTSGTAAAGMTGESDGSGSSLTTTKSPIAQKCDALEQLIKTLDELSSSLTNTRMKEGPQMRGVVH